VLSVTFANLAYPRTCAAVQEHCLSIPFNWPAWLEADCTNVQVDMPARLARLAERHPAIMRIRAELIERLAHPAPFVSVGEERWPDVADRCEALGAGHHAEATEGLEGPFRLNRDLVMQMANAGLWRVFIARVDGALAGYCCWTHETNHEADAPLTMAHGPFYVVAAHKRHHLGLRLLEASRTAFAAAGYRVLKLHHTMHGRGARAGGLYSFLGATEYQREYIWRIGETSDG
jgi:hypothetical protein